MTQSITIDKPSMIDGDPYAVEERVLEQLPGVLDEFAAYVDEAARQLANTERSRLLRADRHLSADDLAEAYAATERAGSLARLTGAAKAMCAAAAELEES